jgi:hypothetical protein
MKFVTSYLICDKSVVLGIYFNEEFGTYGMVAINPDGASLLSWGGFKPATHSSFNLAMMYAEMVDKGETECELQLKHRALRQAETDANRSIERARQHMIARMHDEG